MSQRNRWMFVGIAVSAIVLACSDLTPPTGSDTMSLKRQSIEPDPVVASVDPTSAPQDTTLDLRVFGDNFDDGSSVQLKKGKKPSTKVVTNSTSFVSPNELVANVTIAFDADTGAYDVEVTTSRKRRGVGTEMFAVRFKGNPNALWVEVTDWEGKVRSPLGALVGEISQERLWLDPEPIGHGKNAIQRELCVDLSELAGGGILDAVNYDFFVSLVTQDPTSTGMDNICSKVLVHTRDHSNPAEGMVGQAPGSVEYAGGKIVLKDFQTKEGMSWEWRLLFDVIGFVDSLAPDLGQGVCVARPDSTTWYMYNDDDLAIDPPDSCAADAASVDNIAGLWRGYYLWKNGPWVFVKVAEFRFPFRFRLSRLQ